jgi:hypothetical protein
MSLKDNIRDREYNKFDEDNSVKIRSDEIKLIRTDVVNSSLTYEGRAIEQSSLITDAVWQIKRISVQGTETVIEFADSGKYTQIWNDRNSLFSPVPFVNTKSLQFDGVNDYVNIPNSVDLQFGIASAFSVSWWIKTTAAVARDVLQKKINSGQNPGWGTHIDGSQRIQFELRNAVSNRIVVRTSDGTTVNNGNWRNVIYTYSGSGSASGVKIYLDGVLQTLTTVNDTLTSSPISNGPLRMCADESGSTTLACNLDEPSIWGKELSQSEVTELYNLGVPNDLQSVSFATDLISWWRNGDNDTFPTILDQEGANHGTMINMTSGDIETEVAP